MPAPGRRWWMPAPWRATPVCSTLASTTLAAATLAATTLGLLGLAAPAAPARLVEELHPDQRNCRTRVEQWTGPMTDALMTLDELAAFLEEKHMNQAGRLPVRLLMAGVCTFTLAGGALTGRAPAYAAVCAPYQHITVHGTDWIRSPDNFGGGNACLNQPNGTVSFTVKSQTAPPPAGNRVAAYPHLTRGCEFPDPNALGDCTKDWTAKPVTQMTGSTITWTSSHTGVAKTARYNTGADLWFSATPQFSAPITEVMFWQNVQGLNPSPRAVKVRKDGHNWWYWTEPAASGPFTWTEVIFMRTRNITSWNKIPIQPLLNYAVQHAALNPASYWESAALGFELWNGGGGLKTTSGWIHQ